MKNKLYISLLAACAVGLSSCERDIDNFMVDDTIGLINGGLVEAEVYTGLDDPYKVYAIKAGKGFQSASVSIAVDDQVLADYNATAATQLSALPADCYTITVSSLQFSKDDYKKPFEISWNRDRLAEVLAENANVAIPLHMTVAEGINVDEKRLSTLIKPVLETPRVELAKYGLVTGLMPTRRSAEEEVIYMDVNANFIAQQDIDVTFTIDPTLVTEYNEAHGTEYKVLPEDAYRFDLEGWSIKKYMSTSRFNFTFIRTALIPENGPSLFGTYVLPIRLSNLSSSNLNEEKSYILYTIDVVAAKIEKTKWSIVDCNSNIADDPDATTSKGDFGPENLIDGTTSKAWRSIWTVTTELPYEITIDFGQERSLYKVGFDIPTGANRRYANSKAGYIEASTDGENWTKIADWTAPNKNQASNEFEVVPTKAQYMKFVITEVFGTLSGVKNPNATSIAEINVWGE